jgi:hypothetical protein
LRQYIEHYFNKSTNDAAAGEHTMYVRRAFAAVQTQQKRTYGWIIAALLLVAVCAGGYAWYERKQLQRQRAMAEDIFYAMKSLDLEIANVQRAVSESKYERYLAALHVYDGKMTEEHRDSAARCAYIRGVRTRHASRLRSRGQ